MTEVPGWHRAWRWRMDLLIASYLLVLWICGMFASGRATQLKGHGTGSGLVYALLFGPLFGLLYAAALPDRGVQTVKPPEAATPSTRIKAVGPDLEKWTEAKKEGRLCLSCNAILRAPLRSGDRCPECSSRKA